MLKEPSTSIIFKNQKNHYLKDSENKICEKEEFRNSKYSRSIMHTTSKYQKKVVIPMENNDYEKCNYFYKY